MSVEAAGDSGGSASVLSDASGQFLFSGLRAGAYLLTAHKTGYADLRYGQRRYDQPGTPIVLSKDSEFVAPLLLHRPGAVTGEITDENRIGIPGCAVYAYRTGSRTTLAGVAQTDDRGIFRIPGLLPGSYVIRSGARELEDRQGLLPTFFGQSTRAAEARTIEVRLDEETGGVRIQPLPGRLSTLLVSVSGAAEATVHLYGDAGRRESRAGGQAPARFDQLAPGVYDLIALSDGMAGRTRVSVTGETANAGILMQASPVLTVRCEAKDGPDLDPRLIAMFARRKDPPEEDSVPRRILCGERGALAPGLWEVATAPVAGRYLAAVRDARQEGGAYEVAFEPGDHKEVWLVFGSRPGNIRGVVETDDGAAAPGAPVYLKAVDPELRGRMGGVREARAGSSGEYRFDGLAPGRYEVITSFASEQEWGAGKTVEVGEGGEAAVNLKLGSTNFP